jgi:hypothetical protein
MAPSNNQIKSIIREMTRLYDRRHIENFKKQYDLQMSRYEAMANGGDGGSPAKRGLNASGSIRELHHFDWEDDDFSELVLKIKDAIRASEGFSEEDAAIDESKTVTESVITLLRPLSRDDIIDVLNSIAEEFGVMEPDDDEDE